MNTIEGMQAFVNNHINVQCERLGNITIDCSRNIKVFENGVQIYETSSIDGLCHFLDGIAYERLKS